MCSAIMLTGDTGLQPFQNPSGWMAFSAPPPTQSYSPEELDAAIARTQPVLYQLLDAVADRAPSLCRRSAMLPLARLAAWTESEKWVRPLDDWAGEEERAECADDPAEDEAGNEGGDEQRAREAAALRSLTSHLLERWEVPAALHGALAFVDGPPVSEAAHRISLAFLRVQAAAGSGEASVLATLRTAVSPSISKATAKEFVKLGGDGGDASGDAKAGGAEAFLLDNPLHALRRAQVLSLGGETWLADATCASKLGAALLPAGGPAGGPAATAAPGEAGAGAGAPAESPSSSSGPGGAAEEDASGDADEGFALTCLEWLVRHQQVIMGEYAATQALDFFLEMRSIDPAYTCVGRTPKTVGAALEAYVATTVDFKDYPDEAFQPNPRGLRPLFELKATIPEGTKVVVPYYGNGPTELGSEAQRGSVAATIRIAEILSLQRLFYEGEMLDNCLQGARGSQAKYLSRARARVSSFWSLTKQEPGGKVEHLCLIEVWHLGQGVNEIRQAEGPRPRTIPDAEAWYWLDRWCSREGIDLSTWDCYS